MKVLKKKIHITSNILSIKVPNELIDKDVEVLIKEKNANVNEALLLNKINIDTKKWKFKREEIYSE